MKNQRTNMQNVQQVSIKVILDRLLRNSLLKDLQYEAVIDYTVDFFRVVGVPSIYEDKAFSAKIENYRVNLPCDFIEDIQVLLSDSPRANPTSFYPARYATDTMHKHYKCLDLPHKTDFTFSINNSFMFTSVENGFVKMNYKAIPVDDEGYPMIWSDPMFLEALEWYIKQKHYTILWDEGKLEDKRLENAKQEYCWAIGRCQSRLKMQTLSQAESFLNSFLTLIPRTTEFATRFQNNGIREKIIRH